jgi:hypothetical protein
MERLFKRQNIQVACGVTYEKKVQWRKPEEVRVDGLTEDLSIEGVRLRVYEEPHLKKGQLVRFDVGHPDDAVAIVRGTDPAGGNCILRLEFVDASQGFLAGIVPIIKTPGVSAASVTDWSAV